MTRLKTVETPAVVGMDTASNRVHCIGPRVGTGHRIEQFVVKAQDPNPDVRRHTLYKGVYSYLSELAEVVSGPFHIFAEEPLSLRNGKTTRLLGLAAGAVWAAHLEFDCFWNWVDVAAWKRVIVGNGNASKQQIQEAVEAKGYVFTEEDWFDAFCLREYGVQMLKAELQANPPIIVSPP